MNLSLGLAGAALIAAAVAGAALAATYTYDGQGRLQTVRTDDAKQTRYTLDSVGNRTLVASSTTLDNAPIAVDQNATVPASAPVQIDALNGGSGANRTLVGVGAPQFGSVTFTTTTITYTPFATHPAAIDTFGYTVQRPNGLTASAVVNVTLQTSTVPN